MQQCNMQHRNMQRARLPLGCGILNSNVGSRSRSAPQHTKVQLANAVTSILAVFSAGRTCRRPRTGMGLQRSMKRADSKRIACGAIGTTCRERARCLCESAVTPAAPLPLCALIRADRDNVPCNRRGSGLGEATRSNEKNAAAQTAGSAHALAFVCVPRACGPGIACEPDRVRC